MAKGNPSSNYPAAKLSQVPDIGKYMGRLDEIMELPPCKKSEPEEVKKRIGMMFKFCEEEERRPTVELLSAFLGVSRVALWKWQRDEESEAGRLIERAKAIINAFITELAMSGKAPYQYVIWNQKNNEGYRDVVEIVPGTVEKDLPDKEKIIKSLPDVLPGENDNDDFLDEV